MLSCQMHSTVIVLTDRHTQLKTLPVSLKLHWPILVAVSNFIPMINRALPEYEGIIIKPTVHVVIETHPHNVIHVSCFEFFWFVIMTSVYNLNHSYNKDYREVSSTIKSTKNIYDHSNITGHTTTLYTSV